MAGLGRTGAIVAVAAVLCAAIVGAMLWFAPDGSRRPVEAPTNGAAGPRIVALGPSVAIVLQDLGLEDLVVGRHGWDLALDPDLPVCGDMNGIDYENLLSVAPTHVLLEWGSRAPPSRLEAMAEERGWTLRMFDLLSLREIEACVEEIGALFEDEIDRGRLAALRESMARAWSPRPDVFEGRVLLLAQTNPPAGVGPGSFHHEVLERIGGTPAIVEGGAWVRFDTEDVVRLAPDGIVLIAPRDPGAPASPDESVEELLARLGPLNRESIPAVREGRVALIDHPHAHTSSTAMVALADELAEVLRGWRKQQSSAKSGQ